MRNGRRVASRRWCLYRHASSWCSCSARHRRMNRPSSSSPPALAFRSSLNAHELPEGRPAYRDQIGRDSDGSMVVRSSSSFASLPRRGPSSSSLPSPSSSTANHQPRRRQINREVPRERLPPGSRKKTKRAGLACARRIPKGISVSYLCLIAL